MEQKLLKQKMTGLLNIRFAKAMEQYEAELGRELNELEKSVAMYFFGSGGVTSTDMLSYKF